MALIFDYVCNRCERKTTNQEMESFICRCKGTFVLKSQLNINAAGFKPYFSPSMGCQVTSSREESKLLREHHLVPVNDLYSMRQKAKNMRKYKRELIHEKFKKAGITYKVGQDVKFDEKKQDIVPVNNAA